MNLKAYIVFFLAKLYHQIIALSVNLDGVIVVLMGVRFKNDLNFLGHAGREVTLFIEFN